jgi:putative serine protease PepD
VSRLNVRLKALTGIRLRSVIRPDAGPHQSSRHRSTVVAAALVATLLMAVGDLTVTLGLAMRAQIISQAGSIQDLKAHVDTLEVRNQDQPDWPAIAALVRPSVVTISTDGGLGSGWVAFSDESGSDLITNLHVVTDALDAGVAEVDVAIGDRTLRGTITRADINNDLALIHVKVWLPALQRANQRPLLAQSVMAIGSPLGLDGSVSIGVISGFRSIEGSDYIQFSAAISPGNSGGPVVDARGQVVAVTTAKFVSPGSEALSLAIPVETVCRFAMCVTAHA